MSYGSKGHDPVEVIRNEQRKLDTLASFMFGAIGILIGVSATAIGCEVKKNDKDALLPIVKKDSLKAPTQSIELQKLRY